MTVIRQRRLPARAFGFVSHTLKQLSDRISLVPLNFEDIVLQGAAGPETCLQLLEDRFSVFDRHLQAYYQGDEFSTAPFPVEADMDFLMRGRNCCSRSSPGRILLAGDSLIARIDKSRFIVGHA